MGRLAQLFVFCNIAFQIAIGGLDAELDLRTIPFPPDINAKKVMDPFDPFPQYNFRYYIRDERTGDYKTQEEIREGENVKGSYTVAEPNGDLRTVNYWADALNGFQATVTVQPGGSPVVAPPPVVHVYPEKTVYQVSKDPDTVSLVLQGAYKKDGDRQDTVHVEMEHVQVIDRNRVQEQPLQVGVISLPEVEQTPSTGALLYQTLPVHKKETHVVNEPVINTLHKEVHTPTVTFETPIVVPHTTFVTSQKVTKENHPGVNVGVISVETEPVTGKDTIYLQSVPVMHKETTVVVSEPGITVAKPSSIVTFETPVVSPQKTVVTSHVSSEKFSTKEKRPVVNVGAASGKNEKPPKRETVVFQTVPVEHDKTYIVNEPVIHDEKVAIPPIVTFESPAVSSHQTTLVATQVPNEKVTNKGNSAVVVEVNQAPNTETVILQAAPGQHNKGTIVVNEPGIQITEKTVPVVTFETPVASQQQSLITTHVSSANVQPSVVKEIDEAPKRETVVFQHVPDQRETIVISEPMVQTERVVVPPVLTFETPAVLPQKSTLVSTQVSNDKVGTNDRQPLLFLSHIPPQVNVPFHQTSAAPPKVQTTTTTTEITSPEVKPTLQFLPNPPTSTKVTTYPTTTNPYYTSYQPGHVSLISTVPGQVFPDKHVIQTHKEHKAIIPGSVVSVPSVKPPKPAVVQAVAMQPSRGVVPYYGVFPPYPVTAGYQGYHPGVQLQYGNPFAQYYVPYSNPGSYVRGVVVPTAVQGPHFVNGQYVVPNYVVQKNVKSVQNEQ